MKKLITPSLLFCILIAFIVSSCGNSSSLTKRRYNRGYYASHSHAKKTTPTETKHEKVAVEKIESIRVLPTTDDKELNSLSTVQTPNKVITAEKSVAKKTTKTTQADKSAATNNLLPAELSLKKPFKSVTDAVNQKLTAGDDDGLSLFWIVILVLLILFVFGAIDGGLGALIYILLVVALVLLILWLLKIL